jgi:hypothetical protein
VTCCAHVVHYVFTTDFSTAQSGGQDLGGVVLLGVLVVAAVVVAGLYYNSL